MNKSNLTQEVLLKRISELENRLKEEISARQEFSWKLEHAQARLDTILKATPDVILFMDAEGTIFDSSSNFSDLLGIPKEEINGRNISDFFSREVAEYRQAKVLEVLRSGQPVRLTDDKRPHMLFETEISPIINKHMELTEVFVRSRNITQQKKTQEDLEESEQKYRTLFETAGDGIFIMKGEYFIDCNVKVLEQFRCTRDQIIGHTPMEFSPRFQPDGSESTAKAMQMIGAALDGAPQCFEWKHKRMDNTLFDVEVSLNMFQTGDREYIQAILRDISERKNAEVALKDSELQMRALTRKLIEAQEDERKYLSRELHDELGQKLTGLNLELATLKRKPDSIDTFAINASELLSEVSESLSRIYNGLRPVIIDKLGLRQAVIALVESQFCRRDMRNAIDCYIDERIEDISEDRLSITIYRILQEIFNNINKHSEADKISISLKKDSSGIFLEVCDNGTGIDSTSIDDKISFGILGMKERARQHGGELIIDSSPGSGTRITATFPDSFPPAEVR